MPYKDPVKRRENMRERGRKWRAANPDKASESERKWRASNPDKVRAYSRSVQQKRRASCKTETNKAPTPKQLTALLKEPCLYCGDPAEHVDHFIPLARGGAHVLSNLVPACAACNISKGAKLPDVEWAGRKKYG